MDKAVLYKTLSNNIRYIRNKHNLSRKEMASIIGISVSTLCRLDAGETGVRMHCVMLNRVCDYFNLSADVILRERLEKLEN